MSPHTHTTSVTLSTRVKRRAGAIFSFSMTTQVICHASHSVSNHLSSTVVSIRVAYIYTYHCVLITSKQHKYKCPRFNTQQVE